MMIGLALFVYIRPEHTKKVIESIKRNYFEKIYIFQDGIRDEKDRENWNKVSEIIRKIDFTETEIHISEKNKGLANSIVEGMNYMFERHESVIALEDDVILANGFKHLVEILFEKYRNNKKVMSICGGGYGVVIPEKYDYDVYFSYRMSSVAFGTWKDRWDGFERNPLILKEINASPEKKAMLNCAGNDIEKTLFKSLTQKSDTWATYWVLHQINMCGYHVIPVKGYAKDIGREGSGTNTTTTNYRYEIQLDGEQKDTYNLPEDIVLDDSIVQDTMDLMNVAENKFQNYFEILCNWMKIYQSNKTILNFFIDKGITDIYIYGIGKLTELFLNDISQEIKVQGYIVENKQQNEYNEKWVYDAREYSYLRDIPIVIMPSYDISLIRHYVKKYNIKNKIIQIDEIIQYILKGKNKQ